ncbi:phosphodiesterase [Defluviimonas sp. 20V17]|uniref:Phosphodiesterase n=1 Tax=Allgaiera indica TaxID=765699 RepID=A0AAN4UNZ7_9RHOB|nr:glycerophosphodiester phosphodiesterase family protein [Allgaiera indica]KDB04735.1 phosphodiesterase [Defluviimonas sp. 20V17]GHD99112.1 phosphodiesterase [Allgaiera indica]SDW00431.1 Glycerophosphoryl diester phosphodiesterase [Allgaiera indica]
MTLPRPFLHLPIAHRAYHDKGAGRPENSLSAVRAAVMAGYGIEIDLQPSSDGVPMVFHDYSLERLTGATGPIRGRSAAELGQIPLTGGDEGIPTLTQVLAEVAGRVPLLVEIKDQDGALGPDVGALETAAAPLLTAYPGPVAVMSFNPHSMVAMARLAPDLPRGLTTCAFRPDDWRLIPPARLQDLSAIPDYDRVSACFISHEWKDLGDPRVAALRGQGAEILCWTIRSAADEAQARRIAGNITFEQYAAEIPA